MNSRQNITYPSIKGDIQFDDNSKQYTAKSSINGSIDIVFMKDYLIELAAPYKYKITKVFFKLTQGTCILNIRVNEIISLSNILVTDEKTFELVDIDINLEDILLLEITSSTNSFGLNYAFHIEPLNNEQ